MIRRYDFGTPYRTDAVVVQIAPEKGALPFFTVKETAEGGVSFAIMLGKDDVIFGLGETVRGMNKRGWHYVSWNADEPHHTETTKSLYAAHNVLFFSGECGLFGVFFDQPGKVEFDLGYTRYDQAVITCPESNVSVFIIEEKSLREIARTFHQATGRAYIPPRWGFGYIQSRWGYATSDDVRTVVKGHRENHIPLDGLSMDIDYMDHFKDFTWDPEKVPDLKGLADEMRDEHIHLVPIMDAGVKEEEGDPTYDEGIAKGYFCKKADGKPFVGAVWPGRAVFPDFLQEEVRSWFGNCYRPMLDAGVEGWWNDMNEPALFFSEETLQEALDQAKEYKDGKKMNAFDVWKLQAIVNGVKNNPEDYRRFYHVLDGKPVNHEKVHNLFGYNMIRATAQGLKDYNPDKRFLLFGRSSYIGAHRYGGVWQGDNKSWWSHLLMNLRMTANVSLAGFQYTGADLGGFGQDTTEDLVLRWLEFGIFTPLMRNHTAQFTRDQEAYRFSMMDDMRNIISVRYAILPWLYSEFMKTVLTGDTLVRPLMLDFPNDPTACRVEDQVMLGEGAMLAPVYEQNAVGRHVYLPEDMLLVRFRSAQDYETVPMQAGHHWVDIALNEAVVFLRRGCLLPLSRGGEYADAVTTDDLTLLGWTDGEASYALYTDDGLTTAPDLEKNTMKITVSADGTAEGPMTLYTEKLVLG